MSEYRFKLERLDPANPDHRHGMTLPAEFYQVVDGPPRKPLTVAQMEEIQAWRDGLARQRANGTLKVPGQAVRKPQ